MAKIIINGTEFTGEAFGSRQLIQNAHRDTLTFKFDATGSFDALLAQLADTSEIAITETKTIVDEYDEEGNAIPKEVIETTIYDDYTLVFKRAIENELVSPETPSAPAVYRDVYVVGLAQKTYLEKQVEELQKLIQNQTA